MSQLGEGGIGVEILSVAFGRVPHDPLGIPVTLTLLSTVARSTSHCVTPILVQLYFQASSGDSIVSEFVSVTGSSAGHVAHFSSVSDIQEILTFPVFSTSKLYSRVLPSSLGVESVVFIIVHDGEDVMGTTVGSFVGSSSVSHSQSGVSLVSSPASLSSSIVVSFGSSQDTTAVFSTYPKSISA